MSLRTKVLAMLFCAVLITSASAQSERTIPASQAAQHVGESATVCGYVASTRYLSTSRSKPTFLNLDKPYPNQDFTVVIGPRTVKGLGSQKASTFTRISASPDRLRSIAGVLRSLQKPQVRLGRSESSCQSYEIGATILTADE